MGLSFLCDLKTKVFKNTVEKSSGYLLIFYFLNTTKVFNLFFENSNSQHFCFYPNFIRSIMGSIQQYFVDWYTNNNTNSLLKAQDALYPVIRRKVKKFFKSVNEEDLDDITQNVVLYKSLKLKERKTGGFSRKVPDLMASLGHTSPKRHRNEVLHNYFCDLYEKRQIKKQHRKAIEYGLIAKNKKNSAYKQMCDEMKSETARIMDRDMIHHATVQKEGCIEANQEEMVMLMQYQDIVDKKLDLLNIRNRVVLSLELGLDPSRYVLDLAKILKQRPQDIQKSITRAVNSQNSDDRVIVLYKVITKENKEAYRGVHRRACKQMEDHLKQILV